MEDYDIVSIEAELDRLRDEREQKEKENSKLTRTATGEKSGCGKMILMLFAGLLLFRLILEIFSLFFQR